jgi:hypothetical protein
MNFEEIKTALLNLEKNHPSKISVVEKDKRIYAKLEERDCEGHHCVEMQIWNNGAEDTAQIWGYNLIDDFSGKLEDALMRFNNAKITFFSN